MALLRPNKGGGPATGKTKPSRAEQLMSMTQALAAEQLPDDHTMTAIEGAAEPAPDRTEELRRRTAESRQDDDAGTAAGGLRPDSNTSGQRKPAAVGADSSSEEHAAVIRRYRVAAIRPSPFQPKGRPSAAAVSAVGLAIGQAGSLASLVGPDGSRIFAQLDPEAARLAELAYDIVQHGVRTPLELRTVEDGADECLAGHRRLAAASLAGHDSVPAIHYGPMASAAAAATVLRGNLHRENFTTWQEAVLVAEVEERRRADGHRDTVRTLGAVMGWSHGKVNALLRMRRALSPMLLTRLGDGDAARAEEALARAAYRDLERLATEPDEDRRLAAARRLVGWSGAPDVAGATERAALTHRLKRGGGFLLEVHAPVETLAAGDAAVLREVLESQLARVGARLQMLERGSAS